MRGGCLDARLQVTEHSHHSSRRRIGIFGQDTAVIANTARVWAAEHDLVWYNDLDALSHSVVAPD